MKVHAKAWQVKWKALRSINSPGNEMVSSSRLLPLLVLVRTPGAFTLTVPAASLVRILVPPAVVTATLLPLVVTLPPGNSSE